MLNLAGDSHMKLFLKFTSLVFIATFNFWSCSEASANGSFSIVLSGSMHGQLDPCG